MLTMQHNSFLHSPEECDPSVKLMRVSVSCSMTRCPFLTLQKDTEHGVWEAGFCKTMLAQQAYDNDTKNTWQGMAFPAPGKLGTCLQRPPPGGSLLRNPRG